MRSAISAVWAKAGTHIHTSWALVDGSRLSPGQRKRLKGRGRGFAAAFAVALIGGAVPAMAQKSGGTLLMPDFSSPASMSMHEESTITAGTPVMPIFNNLVVFDQQVAQNSVNSIMPDLATGWTWSEDGKELTFPLRQGVKWHDGKPLHRARRQMHL